jgi:hypothetical protein
MYHPKYMGGWEVSLISYREESRMCISSEWRVDINEKIGYFRATFKGKEHYKI